MTKLFANIDECARSAIYAVFKGDMIIPFGYPPISTNGIKLPSLYLYIKPSYDTK